MHWIVIGYQDGLARAVIAADWCFDRRVAPGIGDFREQELDLECAAGANRARHPDIATHHAREQSTNGQPEAGSGLRLRDTERAALERCKDALEIGRLDAGTGVDHFEF